MKIIITLSLSLLGSVYAAQETIAISELGSLKLEFQTIGVSEQRTVNGYTGTVRNRPGSELKITAPFMPQKVNYLVAEGDYVNKGQEIAELVGSEVHHFNDRFDAKSAIYAIAKDRFEANRVLAKNNSISAEKWLLISQDYFKAKLELGHLKHFSEYFKKTDKPDHGVLIAPKSGILLYQNNSLTTENNILGELIGNDEIRVTVSVPKELATQVSALAVSDCRLEIAKTDKITKQFLVSLWTKTNSNRCDLSYGSKKPVTLYIEQQNLVVPKKSIAYLSGVATIFTKNNENIIARQVNVVGQNSNGDIYLKYIPALVNQQILVTSVSALQGVLLGLGAEE